jgi:hypothetical protein
MAQFLGSGRPAITHFVPTDDARVYACAVGPDRPPFPRDTPGDEAHGLALPGSTAPTMVPGWRRKRKAPAA